MLMDERQFDRLIRAFGAGVSRRATLAALLGSAISSVAAGVVAKPHPRQRTRHHNSKGRRQQRTKGASSVATQAVNCQNLGRGVNVRGCDYTGEDHSGENLSGSTMVGTIFTNGTLIGARLSSSNLNSATFNGADLCLANLRGSTLRNVDFRDADLTKADLSGSSCTGIQFNAATVFCGTKTCNGTVRNDDCPSGPPADFCCADAECPAPGVCCNGVCCDGCCDSTGACGACRVFVTSTVHDAGLGGLSGGDSICAARASAANLPGAGIVGNYKAWLGNAAGSPATRFRRSARPYVLVDGTKIADDWDDLLDGSIDARINVDESGTTVAPSFVWTGIGLAAGAIFITGADCANWTDSTIGDPGSSGSTDETDSGWTDFGQGACDFARPVYCFQQA